MDRIVYRTSQQLTVSKMVRCQISDRVENFGIFFILRAGETYQTETVIQQIKKKTIMICDISSC